MSDRHFEVGRRGEELAAEFLKNRGYKILHRNYRCPMGEIDIIAAKKGVLAVCEVKTRKAGREPLEAVTGAKREQLRRLGLYYWELKTDRSGQLRFDVIGVRHRAGKAEISHIEDAF